MSIGLSRLAPLRAGIVALLLGLGACGGSQPPTFKSTDITGAAFGRDFVLVDHHGKPAALADFRGRILVLFFGFTHCPDVCPTTLAEIATALQTLGEDAKRVQVALVTVDPERDTPDILSAYVTAFNPSSLGLTGTSEQISQVAREFKVIHQKVEGRTAGQYSMDHSAGTYIFDAQGRLRLYVSYGRGPEVFAHDIAQLLKTE
jgi:protein SCO1